MFDETQKPAQRRTPNTLPRIATPQTTAPKNPTLKGSPRRTQDERSAQMRERLHAATIALLIEVGYSNTTTVGIARRANVSRGAQTHHYPEKIDLIVAATEDMFCGFARDLDRLAKKLRQAKLNMEQFLETLWTEILEGNWFYASLEIIVAARGDALLKARLQPHIYDLHRRFEDIWTATFEPRDGARLDPVVLMNIVMNSFRGMSVQAVLRTDKDYYHQMLSALFAMMDANIQPKREPR